MKERDRERHSTTWCDREKRLKHLLLRSPTSDDEARTTISGATCEQGDSALVANPGRGACHTLANDRGGFSKGS
jgi:hypothetical protein